MKASEFEIKRLQERNRDLSARVIPDLEHRTEILYSQIMPLRHGSDDRLRLEAEYDLLSKELRLRCDELLENRHRIARLELEL
ncbi:MAG: hypothetical protein ACFHX7_17875 [Pseudomonadota bacterium]